MSAPEDCLDLRGVPCPQNAAQAILHLSTMMGEDELVVLLDDGEPMINVPESLTLEGHRVLSQEQKQDGSWCLRVQCGG